MLRGRMGGGADSNTPMRSPVGGEGERVTSTGDGEGGADTPSPLLQSSVATSLRNSASLGRPPRSSNASLILTHVLMVVWVVFLLVWILAFKENGKTFGFSGLGLFQWHPLLMVLSFGIAMGEAILMFRSSSLPRQTRKNLHAACNFLAFLGSILGLTAVLVFHDEKKIPHFYSAHSWIGMAAIIGMWSQYISSIFVFGLDGVAPDWLKKKALPFHRFFGKFMFVLTMIAIATGIMQRQSFTRADPPAGPGRLGSVNIFGNVLALVGVFAGASVMYHFESH